MSKLAHSNQETMDQIEEQAERDRDRPDEPPARSSNTETDERYARLAAMITPEKMRAMAFPVLQSVALANAKGLSHPDEQGNPSKEKLAFMLYAAATALETLHGRISAADPVKQDAGVAIEGQVRSEPKASEPPPSPHREGRN